MQIRTVLASVYVRDHASCIAWYSTLFGRTFDGKPHEQCREWKLIEGTYFQVLAASASSCPPSSSIAVVVGSVDEEYGRLRSLDLEVKEIVEYPGFVRTCAATDPEGNVITLVEVINAVAPGARDA